MSDTNDTAPASVSISGQFAGDVTITQAIDETPTTFDIEISGDSDAEVSEHRICVYAGV